MIKLHTLTLLSLLCTQFELQASNILEGLFDTDGEWQSVKSLKKGDDKLNLVYIGSESLDISNVGLDYSWHYSKYRVLRERQTSISNTPSGYTGLKMSSVYMFVDVDATGLIALDAEKNTTPSILKTGINFKFLTSEAYAEDENAYLDPDYDIENIKDKPVGRNYLGKSIGLYTSFESDQELNHYNGVISLQAGLITDVSTGPLLWMPNIYTTFDYVFVGDSTEGDLSVESKQDHLRFTAVAEWYIPLSELSTKSEFFKRTSLRTTLTYSKEFGRSEAWEAAGNDEAFHARAELVYDLPKSEGWLKNFDREFFIRVESGRIAPVIENDTSVMAGFNIHKF